MGWRLAAFGHSGEVLYVIETQALAVFRRAYETPQEPPPDEEG